MDRFAKLVKVVRYRPRTRHAEGIVDGPGAPPAPAPGRTAPPPSRRRHPADAWARTVEAAARIQPRCRARLRMRFRAPASTASTTGTLAVPKEDTPWGFRWAGGCQDACGPPAAATGGAGPALATGVPSVGGGRRFVVCAREYGREALLDALCLAFPSREWDLAQLLRPRTLRGRCCATPVEGQVVSSSARTFLRLRLPRAGLRTPRDRCGPAAGGSGSLRTWPAGRASAWSRPPCAVGRRRSALS